MALGIGIGIGLPFGGGSGVTTVVATIASGGGLGLELPGSAVYAPDATALYGDISGIGTECVGVLSFASVAVPASTLITSATLRVQRGADTGAGVNGVLRLQKIAAASAPATGNIPVTHSWTSTTATVAINTPSPNAFVDIDVTAMVQELLNDTAFVSGNRMNFWIRATSVAGGNYSAFNYGTPVANYGRLTIVY